MKMRQIRENSKTTQRLKLYNIKIKIYTALYTKIKTFFLFIYIKQVIHHCPDVLFYTRRNNS